MAGLIPRDFLDTLLSRTDIVDVIDGRVPLTKKGKDFMACCPFHDEKTPSFSVSQTKQFFYCFGCQERGNAIDFLIKHDHRTFPEAVEELATAVGLEVPTDGSGPSREQRAVTDGLLEVVSAADQFYRKQLREHPQRAIATDYLKQRGLTGEIASRFGLGFAPDAWDSLAKELGGTAEKDQLLETAGLVSPRNAGGGFYDRLRGRIVFPIEDHRGRVVGFGGRVLGDGEPKYLNSPETPLFHKGAELYGLYRGRASFKEHDQACVVEGYMDVIALAQHGIEGAVATMGTATTRPHLERLFRLVNEVVFCFDGDRAGRNAASKAMNESLPLMANGKQVSFLFLPDGEDPDSMVRAEGESGFRERLREAMALPDFMFKELSEQTDLGRIDGRARLVELAKPMLARLPTGVFRDMMVEQLANLARTDRQNLERTLAGELRPVGTDAPKRVARPRPRGAGERLEPLSLAISLMLQMPALARDHVAFDDLAELNQPGVDVLLEIARIARESPEIGSAALLERFRDHRYHARLEELATRDHLIEESAFADEFVAALTGLRRRLVNQEVEALKGRVASGEATDGDRERLNALLKQRIRG